MPNNSSRFLNEVQYSDAETASPPCFLVGTKVDHIAPDNPRQIPLERCTKMAEKMNAIYLEISSRVGTNIDTFKVVLLNAAEKVSQVKFDRSMSNSRRKLPRCQ